MKKTVIMGSGIILLAVLIIVISIFAPRWSRKSEMRERIELLLSPDPLAVVLSEPKYNTDDPLYDGREAVLDKASADELLGKLAAMLDKGYRYKESEKIPGGAWDLSLLVRTAEGKSVQIFFTDTYFYYTADMAAHRFSPDDMSSYADFLQNVNICFDAQ